MPNPVEASAKFEIRRVLLDASPPRAAHSFGWARAGSEVVLEIGYFDLVSVNAILQTAKQGTPTEPVDWFITDRFIMSIEAADRLVDIVQQLKDELAKLKDALREKR